MKYNNTDGLLYLLTNHVLSLQCVKRTRLSPPPDDGDVEVAMEGCLEDVIAGDSSDEVR